jgi:hypothetical protein
LKRVGSTEIKGYYESQVKINGAGEQITPKELANLIKKDYFSLRQEFAGQSIPIYYLESELPQSELISIGVPFHTSRRVYDILKNLYTNENFIYIPTLSEEIRTETLLENVETLPLVNGLKLSIQDQIRDIEAVLEYGVDLEHYQHLEDFDAEMSVTINDNPTLMNLAILAVQDRINKLREIKSELSETGNSRGSNLELNSERRKNQW